MNDEKFNEGDSSPILKEFNREAIDAGFATGTLLDADVNNAIAPAVGYATMNRLDKIEPIRSYEEYMRDKASRSSAPEHYYEYVMRKSNLQHIAWYNVLIGRFNKELPKIKKEMDQVRAEKMLKKISDYILAKA